MAQTYEQRRIAHNKAYEDRFTEEMTALAKRIGGEVQLFSVGMRPSERRVPNTQANRNQLRRRIWERHIKPYFIGAGNDALDGIRPQSPFARLIVEGVEGAIRIQMERQVSIINKYATDPVVLRWLTEPRPIVEMPPNDEIGYDPFHRFVNPNGYRLSDSVWQAAITTRSRIDALLDFHIPSGTAAVDIAELLVPFMTGAAARLQTNTPYGVNGSYAARRLARTEITAAAGRSTINAALANPLVEAIRWYLSPSHPRFDVCDEIVKGAPNGDGVYKIENLPLYPPHPHCLCFLVEVLARNRAEIVRNLRAEIDARTDNALRLRGVFNLNWLVVAMMTGTFVDKVLREAA